MWGELLSNIDKLLHVNRDSEDLAARYQSLSTLLKTHLRREVTEVTQAVEKVLTEKEMAAMAGLGVDAFDKKDVLAYVGMIMA